MGIGGISIWQLLIIALIIVLLFGTKKLRSVGTDLGGALKGFKKAVKDDDEEKEKSDQEQIAEMDSDDDSAAEAAAKAKADAAAAEADRKKQSTASTRNEHSDKS